VGYAGKDTRKIISKLTKFVVLDSWLEHKLLERKEKLLLRELSTEKRLLDFTSNDYLGLARAPELYDAVLQKMETLDIKQNGATGSRLLSGNAAYTTEVEQKLAAIFKAASSLIFNSGYAANLAVLSSIPQRGDTILYDELAHASIKDGARLSLANRYSFRHNDLEDLQTKLKKATGRAFIAVESIYSMDGDQCPLKELVKIAGAYGASIVLDEAHSTGVLGANGSGLAVVLGVEKEIPIRIYTFGKGMGIHGACVAGSTSLIQYLVNFARPFVYTTALPPHNIASIDCAFTYLHNHLHLQDVLQQKINVFSRAVQPMPNRTASTSAIQTALFPGNENVRRAAVTLQQKGFDVRPILSPTVLQGAERLRICIHTFNTDQEILALASQLIAVSALK
jgi:8-amino-7-oxononanoate synthase